MTTAVIRTKIRASFRKLKALLKALIIGSNGLWLGGIDNHHLLAELGSKVEVSDLSCCSVNPPIGEGGSVND